MMLTRRPALSLALLTSGNKIKYSAIALATAGNVHNMLSFLKGIHFYNQLLDMWAWSHTDGKENTEKI